MKKEKQAINLKKRGKFTEAVDLYNEVAHDFQKQGDFEKAIEMAEEGSSLAHEHHKYLEGSFCERLLSELHSQLGNRDRCLGHLASFRRLAKLCSNQSQEQLSHHVEAWCLLQLFQTGSVDRWDLQRAITACHTSLELVDQFRGALAKENAPNGAPKQRKAGLLILEAQIHEALENNDEAMGLLDRAEKLLSANDKTNRYELRRTRCSVAPVARRLDLAELMDDEAPEEKKPQALVELSHHYIVANRLKRGYRTLVRALMTFEKQMSPSDVDDVIKRLVILYRLVEYEKLLKNPSSSEPRMSLCGLHEAIADLYDRYFQSMLEKEKKEYRHFVMENIVGNYEKMLQHKRDDNDALRAYLALALVYGDLDEHKKAMELLEKRLDILQKTDASQDKIIDTRISILNCMCKLKFPASHVLPIFEDLNEKITLDHQKRELYDVWSAYCLDRNDHSEAEKWKKLAEKLPDVIVKNEDDETDILFGRLSEDDVIERCRADNKLIKWDNMTEYQLKKTNDKGETILHREAMEAENEASVERLCQLGCDVNARDNGGWTPLSEAVAHDELGNVRILIAYGADVNTRSAESFVTEHHDSGGGSPSSSPEDSHKGLTPLMDACSNGFVAIARLLIDSKARLDIKDSAGWTALRHLRNFMEKNECYPEHIEFEEFLKKAMENCNLSVKMPPISSSMARISGSSRLRNEPENESPPDEDEGFLILDSISSRKRRTSRNSLEISSKRRPRSGENLRPFPSPSSTLHRRNVVSSSTPARKSISPQSFVRRNRGAPAAPSLSSSTALLLSSRRSMSPSMTIHSAPSVVNVSASAASIHHNDDDDIHVIGIKRLKRSRPSESPKSATEATMKSSEEIALKCIFETSSSCSDRITPIIHPISRSLTIADATRIILSRIQRPQFKKAAVWRHGDRDKCLLSDELSISHLCSADEPLALVFQLAAPQAHEVYQETAKNPISEVTDRLKSLSTANSLDFSRLFLDETEFSEICHIFGRCQPPVDGFRLDLSGCECSMEDETNIRQILENCGSLKIRSVVSKKGFGTLFEKSKLPIETLEIVGCTFKDDAQIVRILEACPNLKTLKLAGIRISAETATASSIPSALKGLENLKSLDISFNSTWISADLMAEILGAGLENLEELTMNETRNAVNFESYWLPALRAFTARGARLEWDTVFEWLSVLSNIDRIDLRYAKIDDASLVDELRKGSTATILV